MYSKISGKINHHSESPDIRIMGNLPITAPIPVLTKFKIFSKIWGNFKKLSKINNSEKNLNFFFFDEEAVCLCPPMKSNP